MSGHSGHNDSPLGLLLVTMAIGYCLWEYPINDYSDQLHKGLWYFGAFVAGIGALKTLPVIGTAFGNFNINLRVFGHDETRGSAGWMTRKQIRKAGLHKCKKGSRFIGTVGRLALWLNTSTSHLILGPAGSEKTTAAILNILMGSPESTLIMDIKGELWAMAKDYRERKFGHICLKVDPKDPENSIKINPLDKPGREVEANNPDALTRTRGIVLQLCPDPQGGGGSNDIFYKGARNLLVTVILAVIVVLPPEHRNLAMVYRVLSDLDILDDLLTAASKSTALNGEVADMARALHSAAFGDGPSNKTFDSFRTNALLAMEAFGPGNHLAKITSESTFEFEELKKKKISLFNLTDYANSEVMGKFSGLIQHMAAEAMVESDSNNPVLFCLDEFCNAKFEKLPKVLTLLRYKKVRCVLATQDLDDIERVYSKHALRTVLSECDIAQFLGGIRSKTTLEYLSSYLGEYTESVSSYSLSERGTQESISRTNRRLMTEEEIRRLPKGGQIVIHANHRPILARKVQVFAIADWRHRIGTNPAHDNKRYLLPVEVKLGWLGAKVTWWGWWQYRKLQKEVIANRNRAKKRFWGSLFSAVMPGTALVVAAALAYGAYTYGLPNFRWHYAYSAHQQPVQYLWCRYIGPTSPELVRGPNCPLILWRKVN